MTRVRQGMGDSDQAETLCGSSIVETFSLVVGGPFYGMLRRLKLVEPTPNIGGRIAILIILTWVPLACLSAARRAVRAESERTAAT